MYERQINGADSDTLRAKCSVGCEEEVKLGGIKIGVVRLHSYWIRWLGRAPYVITDHHGLGLDLDSSIQACIFSRVLSDDVPSARAIA